jgi:hypothetical protein
MEELINLLAFLKLDGLEEFKDIDEKGFDPVMVRDLV